MSTRIPLLLSLFLCACCACKSIPEQPRESDIAGSYYHVKKGDSLSAIARRYRVSIAEIKEVNGITDERALVRGQAIYLPEPDPIGKRIATLEPKAKKNSSFKNVPTPSKPIKSQRVFDFPVPGGSVVFNFSKEKSKPYEGIGIKALLGTKVVAAQEGRVLFVGDDGTKYGLIVIIEHKFPFITVYAHLNNANVTPNQRVSRGQVLGTVGKSGGAAIAHLHFQVRVDKQPHDPVSFLR